MKKCILLLMVLIVTSISAVAQSKTTYAEVSKHQTGWTVMIATGVDESADVNYNNDILPYPSKRFYVLPSKGKLFDSPIYAINYMTQFGFELVEAFRNGDNNTTYILKSNKFTTIPCTTNWSNRVYKTINN